MGTQTVINKLVILELLISWVLLMNSNRLTLLRFERDFEQTVVWDLITVPRAHGDRADFNVPCEHLVKVATMAVGLRSRFHCGSEAQGPQLLDDEVHVVVEVAIHENRSIGILADDIPHDIGDPFQKLI